MEIELLLLLTLKEKMMNDLISHLKRFINGSDVSVQWAKDAETLLDEIEETDGFHELKDIFDDLQDKLSLYRPGGGDHLIDEFEMKSSCMKVVSAILDTGQIKT